MDAERWRVAVHEAGHVACSLALGGLPGWAVLWPKGGGIANAAPELSLHDDILMRLAGGAAERFAPFFRPPVCPIQQPADPGAALPSTPRAEVAAHAKDEAVVRTDEEFVERLLELTMPGTEFVDRVLRFWKLFHEAKAILEKRLPLLLALAAELYQRGVVSPRTTLALERTYP